VKRLHILYDKQCAICRRCRVWLERQPAFVPLVFLPLQSEELPSRFPGIEKLRLDEELVVISDEGDVWQGGEAWVTCLWALREYREWALRLAHPALLPYARRACTIFSGNRRRLSRLLCRSAGDEELRETLDALPEEKAPCYEGFCKPR
jgi:predicted DCC family thiol-disulfide oxidoreductase YuxK